MARGENSPPVYHQLLLYLPLAPPLPCLQKNKEDVPKPLRDFNEK